MLVYYILCLCVCVCKVVEWCVGVVRSVTTYYYTPPNKPCNLYTLLYNMLCYYIIILIIKLCILIINECTY